MPQAATYNGDVFVQGNLAARTMTIPSGTITNDSVKSDAKIAGSKMQQTRQYNHSQAGANIAAATEYFSIVTGTTGTLVSIEAAILETAAGGDRTVTIDLQKSTGGGAFATVLSSTIQLDSGNTIRVLEAGAISATGLVDGDILKLIVTVGGTTGTQPQGLVVTVNWYEDPS